MSADLDCRDLAEVCRRVVAPVLTALLLPHELKAVEVVIASPPTPRALWPRASDYDCPVVRAVIAAEGGERLDIFLGSVSDGPWDAQETADFFYDRLAEELPETRFAWGQQREGRFQVPPPSGG